MSVYDYEWFVKELYRSFGIDLNKYKRTQMERRLSALREKRGYLSFRDYFEGIQSSNVLRDEFMDRMTINVSEYFRNPSRWEVLEKKVLPDLLQNRKQLKIWSSACSTGEEPYSLALLLHQNFPGAYVKILATDIDKGAIAKAKSGIYHERSMMNMPPLYTRYFTKLQNSQYEISPDIRKMVTFNEVNLLEDCFDQEYDLIICRNVIIYFEETAKEILFQKFSSSLKPGGILFVGSTEQIFSPSKYGFQIYDTFFYQKI